MTCKNRQQKGIQHTIQYLYRQIATVVAESLQTINHSGGFALCPSGFFMQDKIDSVRHFVAANLQTVAGTTGAL